MALRYVLGRYGYGLALAALLFFSLPADARSQYDHWAFDVHAGVFRTDLFEIRKTEPVIGARLMRHFDGGFGLGANFDYVPAGETEVYHSYPPTDVDIYMYNLEIDYTFPSPGPLYFFVTAGAGAATTNLDSIPADREPERLFLRESQTDFMLPLGVGLKLHNSRDNPWFAFRLDVGDRLIYFAKRRRDADVVEHAKENFNELTNNWIATLALSFLFGGPRFVEDAPPVFVAPPAIIEEPICVAGADELWWFRNDSPVTVEGRNFVKFGTPEYVNRSDLVEVSEMDGVPIYARAGDEAPYEELLVPLCVPDGSFQLYVPEVEVRGTTG